MTHRDGLPRFSARSVRCSDVGHREACATQSVTLAESLGKPPFRSRRRPVRGHGVSPFVYSGGRPRDPRGHGVSPFVYSGGRPRDPRGRRKALTMRRIACGFPPTPRAACAIYMSHYQRSLV